MDFTYGFPLFKLNETKRAFNYLKYSDEDNEVIENFNDKMEYDLLSDKELGRDKRLIMLANSKRVQNIIVDKFLPELSVILTAAGQRHGIITFNSGTITNSINLFYTKISPQLYEKIIFYMHEEMRSMSAIWIYFDGFINKELEHIIKLKYKAFMLEGNDGKVYIKLSPDENFSLIYDFIDDVMYHC